jgi:hypothetical protein
VVVQSLLSAAAILVSAVFLGRRRGLAFGVAVYFAEILFLRPRDAASSIMSESLAAATFLLVVLILVERPRARHQGYRTQGRTPYQAFLDGAAQTNGKDANPEAAKLWKASTAGGPDCPPNSRYIHFIEEHASIGTGTSSFLRWKLPSS